MSIDTLDEILAKMSKSAPTHHIPKKDTPTSKSHSNNIACNSKKKSSTQGFDNQSSADTVKRASPKKRPSPNDVRIRAEHKRALMLADPVRADEYLRYMAFYYLSKREHSAHELHQKLTQKGLDSQKVAQYLKKLQQDGYQCDTRCAQMMIRECIRMGKGRAYIRQKLQKAKLDTAQLDSMIAQSQDDGMAIDWLARAIEVRQKKFGDELPKDDKQKARQLRFLAGRGFEIDICYRAIKNNNTKQ